ncbi:DM13 domain-containing protein [Streptomyces sp. NBC_00320]|uniref:DM13 domain-containing protein n=1 Tax=Streptomyces sp. NBC_00320 TaxID=2975711 RepID=UPI00225A7DB7|nr:DM13 domain-containing protein [Streptomyces sp. NBC_00320]MCX5151725.1 DM13 domain-containing protein [Streptomyces sp. NBC_00320]
MTRTGTGTGAGAGAATGTATGPRRRRGRLLAWVLIAATLVLGAGLYWAQPWKLWQNSTVNEALPTVSTAPGPGSSRPGAAPAPGPQTVAQGSLISHEHSTSGTVKLIKLPDGSRTLRLENLDTSSGPDLRVWLTDAPVKEGSDGWFVFDDGKHVSLGKLKGNKGDQNYEIPAEVNLADYSSVTIWCDRFNVSFGAAALQAA